MQLVLNKFINADNFSQDDIFFNVNARAWNLTEIYAHQRACWLCIVYSNYEHAYKTWNCLTNTTAIAHCNGRSNNVHIKWACKIIIQILLRVLAVLRKTTTFLPDLQYYSAVCKSRGYAALISGKVSLNWHSETKKIQFQIPIFIWSKILLFAQ